MVKKLKDNIFENVFIPLLKFLVTVESIFNEIKGKIAEKEKLYIEYEMPICGGRCRRKK